MTHPPEALAAWRVGGADPERKETMSDDISDIKADLQAEADDGDILCRAALAEIKAIEAERDELRTKLEKAGKLLSSAIDMTGEPHCYYDHHGYCQAHNLEPRGECWVEQSKAFLAELTGGKDRDLRDAIREALRLMERPDHGDANAMIANFLEAYDMLWTALEEENEE